MKLDECISVDSSRLEGFVKDKFEEEFQKMDLHFTADTDVVHFLMSPRKIILDVNMLGTMGCYIKARDEEVFCIEGYERLGRSGHSCKTAVNKYISTMDVKSPSGYRFCFELSPQLGP